jgi:hypothetical protein
VGEKSAVRWRETFSATQFLPELLDLPLGRTQGLILQQRLLDQQIGGIRLSVNRGSNEGVSLGILLNTLNTL